MKELIEHLVELAIITGMNHEDTELFEFGMECVEEYMDVLEWITG